MRNRSAIPIAGLVALFLVLWKIYRRCEALHVGLPDYLGDMLPIYGFERQLYLTDGRIVVRLLMALAAMGVTVAGLMWARREAALIAIATLGTLAINLCVAMIPRGVEGLSIPFTRPQLEYVGDVKLIGDRPLDFVHAYPNLGKELSLHGSTHPPGAALFLWAAHKAVGFFAGGADLMSAQEASAIAIFFSALAVVPAYWLARVVAGSSGARAMLPLYVIAPNLVQMGATSMDGVFLLFSLLALASGFAALKDRSWYYVALAGSSLWFASFMTFAAVLVPALLGAFVLIELIQRCPRAAANFLCLLSIGGVFILCVAIARLIGYDMVATVHSAMSHDQGIVGRTGHESLRTWFNLSLGNFLAFFIGSGLAATALFLICLTRRGFARRARLARSLLLCVGVASISTLFTMETERVWLPLTPVLLIVVGGALRDRWSCFAAILLLGAQTILTELNVYTNW